MQRNCFPYETACAAFRNHYVPEELAERYLEAADSDTEKFCDLLTMYFASDGSVTDVELLEKQLRYAIKYQPDAFRKVQKNVRAVWKDLKRFPVGAVSGRPEATVSFADSWMQSRTFGGERGHEGTDIMASVNERGLYPVYSMTDGVVENIGWLRLGGLPDRRSQPFRRVFLLRTSGGIRERISDRGTGGGGDFSGIYG